MSNDAGAVAETHSSIDVWSWTEKIPASLDLQEMLTLRQVVLTNDEARNEVERNIYELDGDPGSDDASQRHGIARWLRADYAGAHEWLIECADSPVTAYAFAECCLFGSTTVLDSRDLVAAAGIEALEKLESPAAPHRTLLLRALLGAGRFDDAEKVFAKADDAYRTSADGEYFAGRLAESDDAATARAHYDKCLEIDPDHELTLFRDAYRSDISGEDEDAMVAYERLADRRPPSINSLINLAVLLEDYDRYHEAASCYRRVLSIYPRHPRAKLYLKDAEASLDMHYDEEQEVRNDRKAQIFKIPVSDFELSVRSRNCLAKMNIVTLGDLVMKSEPELLSYKNFGETSLNEIRQILDSKGLRLGMKPEDDITPVRPRTSKGPSTPPTFAIDPNDERLKKGVTELALSVRARKCLANLNIRSLAELVAYTAEDLLAQRNFGVTSLKEIADQLEHIGLSLRTVDK